MGTLKKYQGAVALDYFQFHAFGSSSTQTSPAYYAVNTETSYSKFFGGGGTYYSYLSEISAYKSNMIPVATADTAYTQSDHYYTAVGTTTYSTAIGNDNISYSINVANNSDEDITISCIKFTTLTRTNWDNSHYVLVYGYFLDNPITISAGNSVDIAIKIEV